MDGTAADRLSDLHDPLLDHILSFLPTKEVVRTSSLSKRWKDLWVSHPCISLSDFQLADDDPNNWSNRTIKFINTVDLLLHRHENVRIKKLQLSCRQGVGASEFSRWYEAVMKDGLEELNLNFGRFCENPPSFLTPYCSSLVTLKLYFGPLSGHKFPTSFNFPNLKSLNLNGFILANNFPDQLSKCQNLENVVLYSFTCDDGFSSPDPAANHQQQIIILPNFKNAQIGCSDYAFRGRYDARIFLKNLLTVLSNAKVFDLSLSIIEYLYTCIELNFPRKEQLPKFNYLKHIKIYLQADQIGVMNYILQEASNLESLHVEFDQPYFVVGDYSELKLEQLRCSCSRAYLKVIRLTHLNIENRYQLQLVRLLFGSCGFLEKITIELDKTAEKNPNLQCQKLSELPKLSNNFVLEVKWQDGSHTNYFTLLCN